VAERIGDVHWDRRWSARRASWRSASTINAHTAA
jgi:hypothetical protein